MASFRYFRYFVLLAVLLSSGVRGPLLAEKETLPEQRLRQIVARQKEILEQAAKQGDNVDEESVRAQIQEICDAYELLLHDSPKFATAYASYGYLLSKIDMRKEASAMLLKANQIDPDIPLVKNQLGNYLAEEGRPIEAINYFLAAIKLEPNEPLYHYQLGKLLYAARDDFLKKGIYTRPQLDQAMHEAFRRAAELAPDRIEFNYRYAESFYDLEKPDWDEALKAWAGLEEKAPTAIERQTMRLHAANILIKQGKWAHARLLLDTVSEPDLAGQKQKLVAQLPENAKK